MRRTWPLLLILCLGLIPAAVGASNNNADVEQPTFYKDVLPVLQQNCQVCHRSNGANLGGMVAPMSFTGLQGDAIRGRSRSRVRSKLAPCPRGTLRRSTRVCSPTSARSNRTRSTRSCAGQRPVLRQVTSPTRRHRSNGRPTTAGPLASPIWWSTSVRSTSSKTTSKISTSLSTTEITEEMLPEPRWLKAVEFRPGSEVVHHIIARARSVASLRATTRP